MAERKTTDLPATGRDVEEVLRRAREEERLGQERSRVDTGRRIRETRVADLENPVLRIGRKPARRKFSTFNIILLLFAIAMGIVLYISNILSVNYLAVEIDQLQNRLKEVQNAQANLRAEIDLKSARERIVAMASERLGLHVPRGQAAWIALDEELLEKIREARGE